eukprot:2842645-Ditylum_brightwellii.AAC.1
MASRNAPGECAEPIVECVNSVTNISIAYRLEADCQFLQKCLQTVQTVLIGCNRSMALLLCLKVDLY